jgi:tRNA-dihydrouridine synthase
VEECGQPVVYNGDLLSAEDVSAVMRQWPMLKGVMMGRGLLARPWMLSGREPLAVVREMHARIYDHAVSALQGDSQILARLHAFWDYQTDLLDKKQYKAIMKSGSLRKYREAIAALGWC